MAEEIVLSDEEEAALTAVWGEIALVGEEGEGESAPTAQPTPAWPPQK
jgi:hypothetical protein